jgi:CARDB/Matrixin
MNNQSEFNRLLLGRTEPFTTSLPWEKDTLSLDVTKLASPLAPILTNNANRTLAENFLLSGSYPQAALIGESLLAGQQVASFGLLEPLGLAVTSNTEAAGKTLDQLLIQEVRRVAIAEWASVGITAADRALLETVQITVTDLPSQILGQANGYQILVDDDGAGVGWDTDLTPLANISTGKQQVDLLTLVTHEFGHILGLGHSAQGIMAATLPIGVRVAPTVIDLQQPRVDTSLGRNTENGSVGPDIDLLVTATPAVVPNVLQIGQSLSVDWIVKNIGTNDIVRGFSNGVYLSDDAIFNPQPRFVDLKLSSFPTVPGNPYDTYLTGSFVAGLAAGEEVTVNSSLVIPRNAQPGNKYLLFVAENSGNLTENNDLNNIVAVPITILAPDLSITSVTAPSIVKVGNNIDLNWSLVNNGVIDSPAGDLYNQVVLSQDEILGNADDQNLGSYLNSLPVIGANGGVFTGSNSVSIPNSIIAVPHRI